MSGGLRCGCAGLRAWPGARAEVGGGIVAATPAVPESPEEWAARAALAATRAEVRGAGMLKGRLAGGWARISGSSSESLKGDMRRSPMMLATVWRVAVVARLEGAVSMLAAASRAGAFGGAAMMASSGATVSRAEGSASSAHGKSKDPAALKRLDIKTGALSW